MSGSYTRVIEFLKSWHKDELESSKSRTWLDCPPKAIPLLNKWPSDIDHQLQVLQASPSALQQPFRKIWTMDFIQGKDL